ncbi:hypothetical protein ISS06_02865 [Patescibacteria group bacterium]|nr:hypothetical protein [Patescibacteria group bacterium]
MYFYIYDSFLVGKKYLKVVSKIETRVSTLGIPGKKYQYSILKNIKEMTKNILREDRSPTIVILGSDNLLADAAIALANTDAVLGYIPIDIDSRFAHILGITVDEYACDIISARRIEKVSLGKINKEYFFSSLVFPQNKCNFFANDKYKIIPKRSKLIKLINLDLLRFNNSFSKTSFKKRAGNPKDDYLEVLVGSPGKNFWFFKKKENLDSLFFVKKIEVKSKNPKEEIFIEISKNKKIQIPAVITLGEERLKIIVGKDRLI